MSYKTLIERTIYESKCGCGENDVRTENPPRERLCKCGEWVKYSPTTAVGPDLKKQ